MKAVVRRGTKLEVDHNYKTPEPGDGQVLVRTLCCGICGSDLHALHHLDHVTEIAKRSGALSSLDAAHDVVFGHEFCAEIVDYGSGCSKLLKAGQRVISMPFAAGPAGMEWVGYSNYFPGGFAEFMVLQEAMLLKVPNGLPAEAAALTEPLSVGRHAVNKARMTKSDVAMVIGCGPVGLAVISALKRDGIGPVVASDFSVERRAAAERMGADIIVDPACNSPHNHWTDLGVAPTLAEAASKAALGQKGKGAVIFECVGVPGLIQSLVLNAPPTSRIVVAGVCMTEDRIEPAVAINKEISLQFVLAYDADEFQSCLRDIADAKIDIDALLSETVGFEDVANTFERLENEASLVKVMVSPLR